MHLLKLTLKKELKSFNEGSFCPFVFPFFDTTSLHKTTALQFLALFPQIKERDLRYISLEISATVLTFDQNLVIFFLMKVGYSFLGTASQILALVALFSEFNYTGHYIHILGTYILQDLHCVIYCMWGSAFLLWFF